MRSRPTISLTKSQISAPISPTARIILFTLIAWLKVGRETSMSHQVIARRADVSKGTVSRLMPVLAAEPGNVEDSRVPFIRRRWCEERRAYLITLLPAPEVRGWYETPPPAAQPAQEV